MNAVIAKRRARRIASDEAHAWARSLPLDNPYGKTVLRALTLYVNGEGCCFVSIEQVAEDTDLSIDTVRRRLVWLEHVGALVRLPQWIDENGKRNSEGRGKRTTDEIRLLIEADVDEIERLASGNVASVERDEGTEVSPSSQQGPSEVPENVSPPLALSQPSHSRDHLISEPEPEDSPLPPSGGVREDADGFEEFQIDFASPFQRPSIVRQLWRALKPDERERVCRAARGYFAWHKLQKKPPAIVSAQTFLRERDGWAQWLRWAPGAATGAAHGYPRDSREAKAIEALYAAGRARPFYLSGGQLSYTGEITPQLLAFADAPERANWLWIEERNQIGAWATFLGQHVRGARAELVQAKGLGADQRRGIWAPWPWPPRKDGAISTGPPSDQLISDQDQQDAQNGLIT